MPVRGSRIHSVLPRMAGSCQEPPGDTRRAPISPRDRSARWISAISASVSNPRAGRADLADPREILDVAEGLGARTRPRRDPVCRSRSGSGSIVDPRACRPCRWSLRSQKSSAVRGFARRREAAWRMRRSEETTVKVAGARVVLDNVLRCVSRRPRRPGRRRGGAPDRWTTTGKSPGGTLASNTTVTSPRASTGRSRATSSRNRLRARRKPSRPSFGPSMPAACMTLYPSMSHRMTRPRIVPSRDLP